MKLPALSCECPGCGPTGIITQRNATQRAGIKRNSQRGGSRTRYPDGWAVDFSEYASINGTGSGKGAVGQDAWVVGVVLAELSRGSRGKETAAPLPSQNNAEYRWLSPKRSGVVVSVCRGYFSFWVEAPADNCCKVKVSSAQRSRARRGLAPVPCR